jgi:hypothetical protein
MSRNIKVLGSLSPCNVAVDGYFMPFLKQESIIANPSNSQALTPGWEVTVMGQW